MVRRFKRRFAGAKKRTVGAYRWTRKGWSKVPPKVRFATNFIPGIGGVKAGTYGYRVYRGGKALRVPKKVAEGKKQMLWFGDTAKDVGFMLAGPTIVAGGSYIWDKRPSPRHWKRGPGTSRGRSSSSSSQQNGGRWRSYTPTIPSAQSGKLGPKGGKAKRGFRAGGKARVSRQPYCPVHKRRHWCWFTRKNK